VLANPKLLAALFSSDATEKKRNTEAIETGANQLVSARVTRYTAAHTLPLDEVRTAVKDRLMLSRATELAKKEGAAQLVAGKTNAATANVTESVLVSREQSSVVKGLLLSAIMRADTAALPSWVGVDLGEQGYAVVRVNKVLPRNSPAAETAAQEYAQYSQWLANAELQSYYQLLKERFKVKISVPRPSAETALAATAQ
jgi:peptidyl-prolyl cis-trans isomerase D